jgi:hypothetical protein
VETKGIYEEMIMSGRKALWLVPLLLGACSQNYSEKKVDEALAEKGLTSVTRSASSAQLPAGHPPLQGEQGRHALGGISAVVPDGWQQIPPSSSMRKAEYRLSGEAVGEEDAILAVFYFGRDRGGGLEANIERWYGQFTQPDGGSTRERARRWEKEVNGMPVTLVDVRGTFNSGGMGARGAAQSLEEYRMLGAVVESHVGSFFFKLTGPERTVAEWARSFEQYVDSFRPDSDV